MSSLSVALVVVAAKPRLGAAHPDSAGSESRYTSMPATTSVCAMQRRVFDGRLCALRLAALLQRAESFARLFACNAFAEVRLTPDTAPWVRQGCTTLVP
jgi:hypothetical protein